MTVVTRTHRAVFDPLVRDVAPEMVVVQPRYRGSATAVQYALSRIGDFAADGSVAIFPSHHQVGDDAAFMRHVDLAFDALDARPDLLVLLGATPDGPEVEYCWIEMGERVAEYLRLFHIEKFWEKPSGRLAMRLWHSGCLWNSCAMVGRLAVLKALTRKVAPETASAFERAHRATDAAQEQEAIGAIYEGCAEQDFSHALASAPLHKLAVLPVAGVEWHDLEKRRHGAAILRRLRLRWWRQPPQPTIRK